MATFHCAMHLMTDHLKFVSLLLKVDIVSTHCTILGRELPNLEVKSQYFNKFINQLIGNARWPSTFQIKFINLISLQFDKFD